MHIDLHLEPGQTLDPTVVLNGWDEHGTAVAGITSGLVNDYGISGLVPDATFYSFPELTVEGGARRAAAVAAAVNSSQPGDVVLLEMQTVGVAGWVPAEYDPAIWTIVKNATDRGVIVVAPAGNGANNLDAPEYQSYRDRGDSGAIIVGSGTSDGQRGRDRASTYGARVNVQAFGLFVASTGGTGSIAKFGGDKNQSYSYFGGTSSASAIVASAVVAIQSAAELRTGRRLTPAEMRALLIRTGKPQLIDLGTHIGPLPDLRAALNALPAPPPPPPPIASVFQHCAYGGWQVALGARDYTTADLRALGALDNDASSLRISSGYQAILYDGDNFTGPSRSIVADTRCLTTSGFNDKLSSIRIRPTALRTALSQ